MYAKRMMLACVAWAMVCGVGAPADAAFTAFDDHFTQWNDDQTRWGELWGWNSVGNDNWRQAGHAHGRTVSNGSAVTLQARSDYHLAYLYTNRNDFNFFSQALVVEWTIDTANTLVKPTIEPSQSYGSQIVSLSILNTISFNENDLPAENSAHPSSKDSEAGADISILMQEDGINGSVNWYYTVQGQVVDALPTKITAIYDATNIAITLEGAVFTSTASNTYTSAHGLTATDFADGYTMRVFTKDVSFTGSDPITPSGVSTDRITVNAVPEPATMALLGLGGLLSIRRKR